MKQEKYLYCCSSYYQVLITLMKACTSKITTDIVLEVHGVETANELSVYIKNNMGDYVDKVFVCDNNIKVDPYTMRNASFISAQRKIIKKHVEAVFDKKDFEKDYSKIYVYWDLGYVGTYLNIKKHKYTLIEDSLNSYKNIRKNRLNYAYIFNNPVKFRLKKMFGIGVIPFGYSKYCEAVEVNEKEGIEIPPDKVSEFKRIKLFKMLDEEQKRMIFKTFFSGTDQKFESDGKGILILTEPFWVTKRLPYENTQIKMYKDIIEQFSDGGNVYIKPHPRDKISYSEVFENVIVLEKNIPMEVLNFSDLFKVKKSITVTSSAINGITCDKEKICLGAEFLAKYQKEI